MIVTIKGGRLHPSTMHRWWSLTPLEECVLEARRHPLQPIRLNVVLTMIHAWGCRFPQIGLDPNDRAHNQRTILLCRMILALEDRDRAKLLHRAAPEYSEAVARQYGRNGWYDQVAIRARQLHRTVWPTIHCVAVACACDTNETATRAVVLEPDTEARDFMEWAMAVLKAPDRIAALTIAMASTDSSIPLKTTRDGSGWSAVTRTTPSRLSGERGLESRDFKEQFHTSTQ